MASEALIPIFVLGGFALLWMSLVGIAIAATVFWVFMLIDCAKRKFKSEDEKIIWIIVLAITGVIGALVYYFAVKRPDKK
ncbi:MAG: prolipoprotein diacylglyceryltransferase [Patescibacteria group bacterium]|jgi:prolipoprotein diacylglyceryltransferase